MRLRDRIAMFRRWFRWHVSGPSIDELLAETGACRMCEGQTDPATRWWSTHLGGWVCAECVPAYVNRRGVMAVSHWLDTGEVLSESTTVDREKVREEWFRHRLEEALHGPRGTS